jgi:hypothetical protein
VRASELIEKINTDILNPGWHAENVVDTKAGKTQFVANYKESVTPQFTVDIFVDGERAGYARFVVMNADKPKPIKRFFKKIVNSWNPHLVAGNIVIFSEFRRQGIASALYNWLRDMGNEIRPSSTQTDDGRAFWKAGAGS